MAMTSLSWTGLRILFGVSGYDCIEGNAIPSWVAAVGAGREGAAFTERNCHNMAGAAVTKGIVGVVAIELHKKSGTAALY